MVDIIIIIIIIIIICPLTARAVWAPQMISQQFPPFFPVLHCPLGLDELQACPFPDVVFPPLPLSAFSSPFHCALQNGLARPDEQNILPYHFRMRLLTMVKRSLCSPIACTGFLIGNIVFV